MDLTSTLRSAPSFRLWAAIATIASAMERKVWVKTDQPSPLYTNMYTVLSGGPASGKSLAIALSRDLLLPLATRQRHEALFLAPDNPTKASFIDCLEASQKKAINGSGTPMYSALTVLCLELGVLIAKYDKEFVADLTTLYDCPPKYSAPRRTSKSVSIDAPVVNMLLGATPDALGDILPENAWGQGFTSRLVFVYGTAPTFYRSIFSKDSDPDFTPLKKSLEELYNEVHGQVLWEPDAQAAMEHWYNDEKMAPVPDYARLVNYCGRRDVHLMKLTMISAISAGHGLTVELSDFRRAQSWLFETEKTMPDVFRAMAQKSDAQLLADAYHYVYTKYNSVSREKRQAVSERSIRLFFENKVTHEKIPGLIEAMEKTGRMRKNPFGDGWIPNTMENIHDSR